MRVESLREPMHQAQVLDLQKKKIQKMQRRVLNRRVRPGGAAELVSSHLLILQNRKWWPRKEK